MTKITVQIDTREQVPFLFPKVIRLGRGQKLIKVDTERVKLESGDYRLKEFPEVLVERKAGLRELHKNLYDLKDSRRFARELTRIRESGEKLWLILEMYPKEVLNPIGIRKVPGTVVMQKMIQTMSKWDIQMLIAPKGNTVDKRRVLGTIALCALTGTDVEI